MLQNLARIGFEPVIRVVALDETINIRPRPVGGRRAQRRLGGGNAIARSKLRVAAGHHRLSLVIERAQQLALPAIPHGRSNGADVRYRKNQQQFEALRALHDVGEIADCLGVANIATEGERSSSRGAAPQARQRSRSPPRSCQSAGLDGARCERPRSSDPRHAPWRCRAGRPPRKAARRYCTVLNDGGRDGCGSAAIPRSISDRTPTVRIRCSSTVK